MPPVAQRYQTFFIDHFVTGLWRGISSEDIACIEQVVCALAGVFLGTRLSTFSSYITRLRRILGRPDQAVHFTNGSDGMKLIMSGCWGFPGLIGCVTAIRFGGVSTAKAGRFEVVHVAELGVVLSGTATSNLEEGRELAARQRLAGCSRTRSNRRWVCLLC